MRLLDWLSARALRLLGLDFELSLDADTESIHRITPKLSLGARPRPEQREALQAQGITHVVSCLPPSERPKLAFLEEDHELLFLPLRDAVDQDISAHFERFFLLVSGLGRGQRALVHCEVGVSRSATLAVAYVMQAEQLRFYEAYRRVRACRPQILPNVGFASQLQRLERALLPPAPGPRSLTRYLREVCNVPAEPELIEEMLALHDDDAIAAIQAIFGGEVPRVVQGVRR